MSIRESDMTIKKSLKKNARTQAGRQKSNAESVLRQAYPQMINEFRQIQEEQFDLFCKKQHDYGPGNISVGTQLQTEEEIKLSLTGLWFRINDKCQRLKTLLMNNRESAVKDEPLEDTFLDISNYGIMATIVSRGKWGK